MAVSRVILDVIERDHLLEHASVLGEKLSQRCATIRGLRAKSARFAGAV